MFLLDVRLRFTLLFKLILKETFLIKWKERINGIIPENSIEDSKTLRVNCPDLLLDFYER